MWGRGTSHGRRSGAVAGALAWFVAALAAAAPAQALDNGLARTPQMGFNNWNATHCRSDFNEDMVKATADFFVSSGLKDAGYEYVNLDDCWALPTRDAAGNLQPDPVRFPNGIKAVADYVHSRGLKIGIYSSAGTKTCNTAGFPGGLGHEQQDADLWASWEIDYLKYDNCNNQGVDAVQRYTAMRDSLEATGRTMFFSICEWGQNKPWLWAQDVGNSWRTTGDIGDNYASMLNIVHQNMGLAQYAGPGHWNDPDMLEIGNGGMTDTEYRSHFSLWAMMAAPLLIGSDLRKATPATMSILLNKDVIALDQDPLGRQGAPIDSAGGHHVFVKELANGDRGIALFNETDGPERIATTAAAAGRPQAAAYTIRDLWAHTTRETAGRIAATVPAHGTVVYRAGVDARWSAYAPALDDDLRVAPPYAGGPAIVTPGDEATATTTVTNLGRVAVQDLDVDLSAPEGWTVNAGSPASADDLDGGEALATTWSVSVPADARPGSYTLTSHVGARFGKLPDHTVSTFQVVVPAPPPGGTTNLGDDTWLSATNGYGPVERNTSNGESKAGDGHLMSIEGVKYSTGLGTNAPSEITFYLGRECTSVTTAVGVDDEKSANGSVTFELWADGTKLADSGLMDTATPARTLQADLTGATILRLVVTDGGNGTNSDHGDWADPRLTCAQHPPPAGTSFLSDLSWQSASNGWGPVERDTSVGNQGAGDGRPITINGVRYDKGLGSHAPAAIEYHLGGACTRMQADVGVDDEVATSSTVTFEVWADGSKVFDSGLMTWQDDARPVEADVTGATTLRLVVTDYDGSKNSDHADWGDARITCGGGA
jgi:alpha-galactosidase